ncbi:hypothetical protein TSTA_062090 [Talaromyces stipitatus ATCC 10500]|uniref:Uncharacterized protein n=1 Tax=Talaromyces stipitatus (strain ATCC 10500 / CBS 375.48 / QM 6759 / NRRL 1006) TaxID=441959 RepID=B8LX71_TALSN|nr:uncharacterized protein TSTA_062090 [Talaromyces stipitatus ATCC 10500]EED22721.1 hypothetical protein TSTA_062090 [Talaromyces stipitatus ATCC 10500]
MTSIAKGERKGKADRTQQEQIRKRRHNLFKRLKEFNDRYDISIWLTMEMPSGRIYTFNTNPERRIPTEEEITANKLPVVRKTPADYASSLPTIRDPPPFMLQRPLYDSNP